MTDNKTIATDFTFSYSSEKKSRVFGVFGKWKIGTGKEISYRCSFPALAASYVFEGKTWSLAYNKGTNEISVEKRFKTGLGDVKVKQVIPQYSWALFPTPMLELKRQCIKTKNLTDDMRLSYDYLTRVGKLDETLKLDNKYTLRVEARTVKTLATATCTMTASLQKGILDMASLQYSLMRGPILGIELRQDKQHDLRLEYAAREKRARASLSKKSRGATATLELSHALGSSKKPVVNFGLKYSL